MQLNHVFADDILIRLLQVQFDNHRKIEVIESIGVQLEALTLDLLPIVLDAMGLPPEDEVEDDAYRDTFYTLFHDTMRNGTYEEGQRFLDTVRG